MSTGREEVYDFHVPVTLYFLQGIEYEGPVEVWTPRPHEGGVDDGGGAWKTVEFARGARQPGDRKAAVPMRLDMRKARMRMPLLAWMERFPGNRLEWLYILCITPALSEDEIGALTAYNVARCRKNPRDAVATVMQPWRVIGDGKAQCSSHVGIPVSITIMVTSRRFHANGAVYHRVYIEEQTWDPDTLFDLEPRVVTTVTIRAAWGGLQSDFCGGTILDLCEDLFPYGLTYDANAPAGTPRLRPTGTGRVTRKRNRLPPVITGWEPTSSNEPGYPQAITDNPGPSAL